MHVLVNNEECNCHIHGGALIFTYTSEQKAPIQLSILGITQLMRSRRDETASKLSVEGCSYLLRFSSLEEREHFIHSIVDTTNGPQSSEEWVAASMYHAAVEVGVLSDAELQSIMKGVCQRGVVQAFDALESIVDRETLQLLPITEQMESDILRQIPVLAAVFERHVTDAATRLHFWEAVVRKYFCFCRTFLEEDLRALEASKPQPALPSNPLSALNSKSFGALPKMTTSRDIDTTVNEADLLRLEEEPAPLQTLHETLFTCSRPASSGLSNCFNVESYAVVPPLRCCAPSTPFCGHQVLPQLPSESTEKAALEALRKYWRGSARQRRGPINTSSMKGRNMGLVATLCFQQAERVANGEGDL